MTPGDRLKMRLGSVKVSGALVREMLPGFTQALLKHNSVDAPMNGSQVRIFRAYLTQYRDDLNNLIDAVADFDDKAE